MKDNKLTFKNLSILDLVNSQGNYTRTPEGSEVDELDLMYELAEWCFWAGRNNLITKERYTNLAKYFNSIPSVGEYFRNLS